MTLPPLLSKNFRNKILMLDLVFCKILSLSKRSYSNN